MNTHRLERRVQELQRACVAETEAEAKKQGTFSALASIFSGKTICDPVELGGVEVWRGGVGEAYPLADPFVGRCLTSLAVPLIPHPAHRTGRAERPHPALGERLTVTPTENCSSVW